MSPNAAADSSSDRTLLLEEPTDALDAWLKGSGRPTFHAGQVERWIFERRVFSFSEMTDLPVDLREQLSRELVQAGCGLLLMSPAEAELESIFLQLTSKKKAVVQ